MDRLMSMRVFQRVIDEGGFAAAARALDLSPAVVTRLVADLEDHLGTRLLHRTTRSVSLSAAGEAYLGRVRGILLDVEEARDLAGSHTHELAGVLSVLVQPQLATHMLAPMLAGFRQQYPKIVLDISVESYKEPLVEGYDVVLFVADEDFNGDVIARKIITSEVILVASPAYLKRRGTPEQPEDLRQHDCLRLKLDGVRASHMRLVHPDRPKAPVEVAVDTVLWANHSDTLMRAALDGIGITSAALKVVAPQLVSGELVQVLRPWIYRSATVYAALPSRKFLPQRTHVFLDHLTEQTHLQVSAALQAHCCD